MYLTSLGHPRLAYNWARPAILAAGKGRGAKGVGGNVFISSTVSSLAFIFLFLPCLPLFYCLFYLSSPFLWEMTQNDPQGLRCP